MNSEFLATLMALSIGEKLQPKARSLSDIDVICPRCGDVWTHALIRSEDHPHLHTISQHCPKCNGSER